MKLHHGVALAMVLATGLSGREAYTQDAGKARGLNAWEIPGSASTLFSPECLPQRDGWIPLERGTSNVSLKGRLAISNGRLLALFRRKPAALFLHAATSKGWAHRTTLRLLDPKGEPVTEVTQIRLSKLGRGVFEVEMSTRSGEGAEVEARFRLKREDIAIQVEPGKGAGRLRLEAGGRFVVLPDFFSDDSLIDARTIPLKRFSLPSENFVLHPTGEGDSIAMAVFENRQEDVTVTVEGSGPRRLFTGSEISFGEKKIWVALLEAPDLWHSLEVHPKQAGKISALDWVMPFPALWRMDLTTSEELTDSWEMILPAKGKGYLKPTWFGASEKVLPAERHRWTTVLGRFPYPLWHDRSGRSYLQPIKHDALLFQGPALMYPINRRPDTPVDTYTIVDVVRNCLGVGPCEYILDIEGQKNVKKGRATCNVRDVLTPIFQKGLHRKRQTDVDRALDDGLTFVRHIRERITCYVTFGHELRKYLATQKGKHPGLAKPIAEIDRLAARIDARIAARRSEIKTPEDVARMNQDFRRNVLTLEGKRAAAACRQYCEALVRIGGSQDELVAEVRWVVRALRQKAVLFMARYPALSEITAELRQRSQKVLRNPEPHEGARH